MAQKIDGKYLYGSITVNMEWTQQEVTKLFQARVGVYKALRLTTQGSRYRRWKWACRAVPGHWTLFMRRELAKLAEDMRRYWGPGR